MIDYDMISLMIERDYANISPEDEEALVEMLSMYHTDIVSAILRQHHAMQSRSLTVRGGVAAWDTVIKDMSIELTQAQDLIEYATGKSFAKLSMGLVNIDT